MAEDPRDEELPEDKLPPEDAEGSDEADEDFPPDECIPCPHCGAKEGACGHQILFWSGCNCDWIGPLAEQTIDEDEKLAEAIWLAIRNRGADALKARDWPYPLITLVREVTGHGFNPDDRTDCDWYVPLRDYWLELGADTGLRYQWTFDAGYPGGADTYAVVFAEDPAAAIASMKAEAIRDTQAILQFARALGQPPSSRP